MASVWGYGLAFLVSALLWVGIYHTIVWAVSHPDFAVSIVALGLLLCGSWLILRALLEAERG
jgi:hypothetical protein